MRDKNKDETKNEYVAIQVPECTRFGYYSLNRFSQVSRPKGVPRMTWKSQLTTSFPSPGTAHYILGSENPSRREAGSVNEAYERQHQAH